MFFLLACLDQHVLKYQDNPRPLVPQGEFHLGTKKDAEMVMEMMEEGVFEPPEEPQNSTAEEERVLETTQVHALCPNKTCISDNDTASSIHAESGIASNVNEVNKVNSEDQIESSTAAQGLSFREIVESRTIVSVRAEEPVESSTVSSNISAESSTVSSIYQKENIGPTWTTDSVTAEETIETSTMGIITSTMKNIENSTGSSVNTEENRTTGIFSVREHIANSTESSSEGVHNIESSTVGVISDVTRYTTEADDVIHQQTYATVSEQITSSKQSDPSTATVTLSAIKLKGKNSTNSYNEVDKEGGRWWVVTGTSQATIPYQTPTPNMLDDQGLRQS